MIGQKLRELRELISGQPRKIAEIKFSSGESVTVDEEVFEYMVDFVDKGTQLERKKGYIPNHHKLSTFIFEYRNLWP